MILSFLILFGFQNNVKNKLYSFSSHLQITKYTLSHSPEEIPISTNISFYKDYEKYGMIDHVQQYAYKAGLLRTEDEILGVLLKGVDKEFDTGRFKENMVKGSFIEFDSTGGYSKQVMISQTIADKLFLDVGDRITVHFFQNPPRARKLEVTGIYQTNLAEYFDDKVIIGDIGLIRRLNNWPDSLAGGLEVFLNDAKHMDEAENLLDATLGFDLYVEKISEKFVQVFEWLFLIHRQVNLFLMIILSVVCFNMISILLILILERTQMIGMLKALGSTDKFIRSVFNNMGRQLIFKGLIIGNSLAMGLGAIQHYFKVIPLNPKDYYISYVPISWNWDVIIGLNLLTVVVVSIIMAIPTLLISRIQPIRAIRFD